MSEREHDITNEAALEPAEAAHSGSEASAPEEASAPSFADFDVILASGSPRRRQLLQNAGVGTQRRRVQFAPGALGEVAVPQ